MASCNGKLPERKRHLTPTTNFRERRQFKILQNDWSIPNTKNNNKRKIGAKMPTFNLFIFSIQQGCKAKLDHLGKLN